MIQNDLWNLAQDFTLKSSLLVHTLIHQRNPTKRDVNLSVLAGTLFTISSGLSAPLPVYEEKLSQKLDSLLSHLEAICLFPNQPPLGDIRQRFHTLRCLLSPSDEGHALLKRSLKKFAAQPVHITITQIDDLKRFAPNIEDEIEHNITPLELSYGSQDYPARVNKSLYTVLQQHALCACAPVDSPPTLHKRHQTRLQLTCNLPAIGNDITFNTLVSRKPITYADDNEEFPWQKLQFNVPRRTVKFQERSVDNDIERRTSGDHEPSTTIDRGRFCSLLGMDYGRGRIRLKIQNETLIHLSEPDRKLDEHAKRVAHLPSISLAEMLQNYRMTSKNKILLAYVLARSVWQFYNSDWMKAQWSPDCIHFMWEQTSNTNQRAVDPGYPYLACTIDESAGDSSIEYCSKHSVYHRYPLILALGVLLIRICQNQPLNTPRHDEALETQVNTDFFYGQDLLENESWPDLDLNVQAKKTYKSVVKACLNHETFKQTGESDIPNRREILWKVAVYPLARLAAAMGWLWLDDGQIHRVDAGNIPGQQKSETLNKGNSPATLLYIHTVAKTAPSGASTSSGEVAGAESRKWLNDIQFSDFNVEMVARFRNTPRIKVAVLDTGYDPGSIFFTDPDRKSRIRRWKDFVEETSKERQDVDGHGTHVLSLVMTVAPIADLYVARIAKGRAAGDLSSASDRIAKAIKHAVEKWDVDIIVMSFGFPEEQPQITKAILNAQLTKEGRILFFAGAANEGGNLPEMFPAKDVHVIAIRGSNEKGYLQDFNPPPSFSGLDCFMTLGKDVPGAALSLVGGDTVPRSGTSTATPIAAGIAALLLGYARVHEAELRTALAAEKLAKLHSMAGICSMFQSMSTRMTEKCYYLSPNKFIFGSHDHRLTMIKWSLSQDAVR